MPLSPQPSSSMANASTIGLGERDECVPRLRAYRSYLKVVIAAIIASGMFLAAQRLMESLQNCSVEPSWALIFPVVLALIYRILNAYGWTLVLRALGARDVNGAAAIIRRICVLPSRD